MTTISDIVDQEQLAPTGAAAPEQLEEDLELAPTDGDAVPEQLEEDLMRQIGSLENQIEEAKKSEADGLETAESRADDPAACCSKDEKMTATESESDENNCNGKQQDETPPAVEQGVVASSPFSSPTKLQPKQPVQLLSSPQRKTSSSLQDRMKKFGAGGAGSNRCAPCGKPVYFNDAQITLDGSKYHKECAKCQDCRCQITLRNFTKCDDVLLCKTHYFKRFHEENSYMGGDKFTKSASATVKA